MHIYIPLLLDFRLKEVIPQSKLRGKSGAFSPHLRPSRDANKRCRITLQVNIRPCPPKTTNYSSGQSLKAKAVIPDIPHCPMNSKPVVFKNRYKVQKHSCYDGDGVYIRRQKGPGLILALSVRFICKMSHKQHSPLFFTDLIQNINSISDQGLKDPISQLHLHTQLILIIVHPLCLLLVELLYLEFRKQKGQKITVTQKLGINDTH